MYAHRCTRILALARGGDGDEPGVLARRVAQAAVEERVGDLFGQPAACAGGDVMVENEALRSGDGRLVGTEVVRICAVDKASTCLLYTSPSPRD